jgi:arylsulfatase A-like enzyme
MRRPNILILSTDQQRHDALGCAGNPDIQTPRLDALAAEGLRFSHYLVQHPLCMPSRVSFLSGQYPATLGITHMGVPVPERLPLLPHLLRPYGYVSASFGKLHFLPHANRDHRVPHPAYGFDRLEVSDEPGAYEDAYRAWVRRRDPHQLDSLSVGLPPAAYSWYVTMGINDMVRHPTPEPRFDFEGAIPFPADEAFTHSAFVADQTLSFLDQQRSDGPPWLCIAGFYSPHAPWVVPQRYLDRYDRERLRIPTYPPDLEDRAAAAGCTPEQLRSARHGYYAMVSEVDHYCGQILDRLEERDMDKDTIVLFLSDHGEWLGEHLRYGKGAPGDDAVARVPLLMRWPAGVQRPGRAVDALVEAVDLLPTLLECAGLPVAPHLQGQSLAPAVRGEPFVGKGVALMEYAGWKSIRSAGHRFLIHADGREQLWDLASDPGEYHDVAGEPGYAAILAEHRRLLLQRLIAIERPLPRAWPY